MADVQSRYIERKTADSSKFHLAPPNLIEKCSSDSDLFNKIKDGIQVESSLNSKTSSVQDIIAVLQSNQFRHKQSCCDYNEMIPEGELQTYISQTAVKIPAKMASTETQSTITHDDGIIKPKKLPNPCKESIDRQKLHRELLFNQKIGKNVLNQKSELQVALQKYKDSQIKKEIKQQKEECKTPFQKVIEERAKKIEMAEKTSDTEHENSDTPEFLQVHAKLRAKMDSK